MAALFMAALAVSPVFAFNEGPVMGPYVSAPGLTAIQQCKLTVAGKVMDPADGAVLQKGDVVMIPLRKVAEQLGYDYVSNGEINSDYQGHEAIVNAHNYRAQALAELPIGAQSLMKGDPVIPTEITVL